MESVDGGESLELLDPVKCRLLMGLRISFHMQGLPKIRRGWWSRFLTRAA